ncbi:sensor domain-containing protein [Rubrobacter marinus]|uniref:sensor domain-containing protein n=1 Tax=Rubrobacter marinus TaxID=2653852 RepID=UPI00140BF745|nr:EAL domain-containing protein [Rubrobacter marinus]
MAEHRDRERMLREAERRHELLLGEVSDGVWEWDARTGTLSCNDRLLEILGLRREGGFAPSSFEGLVELVHPEDRGRLLGVRRAMTSGALPEEHERPAGEEVRLRHRTGAYRPCALRLGAQRDEGGEVLGAVGVVVDLAERREAEEALRRSAERLRTGVGNVPIVLFALDRDGVYTLSEGAGLGDLGLEPGEVLGRSIFEVYRDSPRVLEGVRRALSGEAFSTTTEVSGLILQTWYSPLRSGDGEVTGVAGVCTDITERKRAEERIHFQARLLDAVGQAVVAIDLDGRITYWNRSAETLYGWSAAEALGRLAKEVLVAEEQAAVAEEIYEGLKSGGEWSGEFRVRRRDGSTFPALVTDTPVHDERGNLIGTIGIAADISRRKATEEALRESEERFRAQYKGIPIPTSSWRESGDGGFVLVDYNDAAHDLTRGRISGLVGRGVGDVFPGEPEMLEWFSRCAGEQRSLTREFWLEMSTTGQERYFVGTVAFVPPDLVMLHMDDVTERKLAELQTRRFVSLVENSHEFVAIADLEGRVTFVNEAGRRMVGLDDAQLGRTRFEDCLVPEEAGLAAEIWSAVMRDGFWSGELRLRHLKTGEPIPVLNESFAINDPETGRAINVATVSRDIAERKRSEEELRHQAFHDSLTGLPNRHLFLDRLQHALDRAARRRDLVAVLFLDLDNFKVVNDSLGHDAGDKLLTILAERLSACLRPEDTAARFGGDEFAVLLEDVKGTADAIEVARRIAAALRATAVVAEHEVFAEASIGITLGGAEGDSPEGLLRQADVAMYEAKRKGKANYEVFASHMDVHALERLKLEADLRRAIERGEFRVHYQPKLALDGFERRPEAEPPLLPPRIVGMEALVRWEHPEDGLIPPARFVPLAEETGLIVPMGRWVLEEACRRAVEWQALRPSEPPLTMSVNLSARQFEDPGLVEDVARILRETGLDPRHLTVEITESVSMKDARSAVGTLRELKSLGVCLAIDDFGTGYSSLAYLHRFPADFLKIDRSFVGGLGEGPEEKGLVPGVVGLAHTLGMKAIAEGVETAEQLARLREMGCDLAQGFYFSRPLPGEAIPALLSEYASGPRA